jgi:hypothetical protein
VAVHGKKPDKSLFRRELIACGQGIHRKNGYSAGNYQLKEEESTGGMGFCPKLPAHRQGFHSRTGIPPEISSSWTLTQTGKIKKRKKLPMVTISGSATPNLLYYKCQLFKTFKYENCI